MRVAPEENTAVLGRLPAAGRCTILVVTDRYVPEVSAAATRLHAHAKRWIAAGHDIHVVTCVPNFPRGQVFEGYSNKAFQTEIIDGVAVHRVKTYMAPNTGKYRRALDYFSFPVSSALLASKLPRPHVILASSPPITVALAAQALAWRFGCPWVFEVRDLWPASIRAVGVSRGRLINLIEKYELSLYRRAAAVIALTTPFKADIAARGIPAEKIRVVTNGVEADRFIGAPSQIVARRTLGLPADKFIVGFVGTVGLAQGAGTFVLAAKRLAGRADIRFVCFGEGADRPKIQAMSSEFGLSNVEFRDFLPSEMVPTILSAVDTATVLLKRDKLFETVIPSKIFEILAAGRPIAACVAGEARALIEASGGGVCVDPEDDEGLARIVTQMADDRSARDAMAARGVAYIRTRFSRDQLASEALDVILEAARVRSQ